MMAELLDFFLGAIHLYVTDPAILPIVDAVGSCICVTFVLGTCCSLVIWCMRLIFYAFFGGSRNV